MTVNTGSDLNGRFIVKFYTGIEIVNICRERLWPVAMSRTCLHIKVEQMTFNLLL